MARAIQSFLNYFNSQPSFYGERKGAKAYIGTVTKINFQLDWCLTMHNLLSRKCSEETSFRKKEVRRS